MSTSPRPEHPSTYFVQDRANIDELSRLQIQGSLITQHMDGVLAEQPDPTKFQRVLDVGCGTGNWIIETAQTYPDISMLIGVDISNKLVAHAREQAEAFHLSDRVQFYTMDALRMLEFPGEYFDLVNQRSAISYLRTWDWPKILQEYQRVARPGGIIRITEGDVVADTNSQALVEFTKLFAQAFHQAGHLFRPETGGLLDHIPRMLHRYGVMNIQTHMYIKEYRSGSEMGKHLKQDAHLILRTSLPFLKKWIQVPEDYQELCQRVIEEMDGPDFTSTVSLLTTWGVVPAK